MEFVHLFRVPDSRESIAMDNLSNAGTYIDGPFKGRRKSHPYSTILARLNQMGITPHVRQMSESDRAYVERMSREYSGLFADILAESDLSGEY